MTYTYVLMPVSRAAYEEIRRKLEAADYYHAFHETEEGIALDMHGIALVLEEKEEKKSAAGLIDELTRDLPPEVFEALPTDGATEHDHYLYGTPKKAEKEPAR